ncbi:cyun107 [Cyclophragma undans nucleopolyhedrovirus]|uniref:Cyun107 n=1 Tax=Cyclophragma undans nucleopolyhedrovirus TaxID=1906244 RepID=A0A288QAB6_9ABAC|nr:cyun107 [Cyclophragma undans nucleopolyhedrovirus]AOT85565.1 cyun107 [Cyclophragma undans nucleopolyhedrovirus]
MIRSGGGGCGAMHASRKYAVCYLCEEIVYLYNKKLHENAFTSDNAAAAAAAFYRRHMAIVRSGFVLCPRCHLELNNKTQNENGQQQQQQQ